ncbi:citrulline utilization hydrolase CtlX [Robertkochia solimangrovi]|uniref:citrulline utilization hydrolase CtlX n=1 Tax=Robertkochia solimangrovi TaxID=2213046 RepID=UPI00117CA2F7|nr:arginine deiminase-related protein [Robertkochia solimangrovi]TRZ44202.1 amidinotransferase [Robertkochia solimangrovi]
MKQNTDTLLMIRPVGFRMNEQTAVNNYFQESGNELQATVNARAQAEFDNFVSLLRDNGVAVIVADDTKEQDTPDSVFPNNWISFHENGNAVVYPMFAENRRLERREDVLELIEENGFVIQDVYDYTEAEDEGIFLEGTGSIILDRVNRKAYCALSERADEDLFIEFCEDLEYFPVIFNALQTVDGARKPIYHTNVMMNVGESFAVVCLDSIDDKKEKKNLVQHLKMDGKEIISITEEQMHRFAGNMLEIQNKANQKLLVMSEAAFRSLNSDQISKIENYARILYTPLPTIEKYGGGSARCMMAEIFLPKK